MRAGNGSRVGEVRAACLGLGGVAGFRLCRGRSGLRLCEHGLQDAVPARDRDDERERGTKKKEGAGESRERQQEGLGAGRRRPPGNEEGRERKSGEKRVRHDASTPNGGLLPLGSPLANALVLCGGALGAAASSGCGALQLLRAEGRLLRGRLGRLFVFTHIGSKGYCRGSERGKMRKGCA